MSTLLLNSYVVRRGHIDDKLNNRDRGISKNEPPTYRLYDEGCNFVAYKRQN